MSLTGTPFFITAIVLAVIAVLLPLVLWSRLRGPAFVRGVVRLLMVGFAQVTAVLVVFVAVNNTNNLYDTWADLLGTANHVDKAADLGPDGTGGKKIADLPKVKQTFTPATDSKMGAGVQQTTLDGKVSGVKAEVYVWLPPQYDDPAYRDRTFPVVEVLSGYPGSPKAWFGSLHANDTLGPLMKQGKVAPFILVAPRTNLLPDADTGCANVTGKVNADSWLTVDVRKMVVDNFRASAKASDWALAGYSAGAHCAAKLALAHPDRYSAAVAMNGYNDPAAEPDALTAKDPKLRRENNPLNILKAAPTPPRVSLLFTGKGRDGYRQGLELRDASKPPTYIEARRVDAPHTTPTWQRQVRPVFEWLTRRMEQQTLGQQIPGQQGTGTGA
ncbi:alpha/beta hydrolase [Streptomyces purpureus]|uniref:Esterase n=1 Tax=Streptomyces purpureus TaxID=1951 RepID=A0A918LW59_9ACTN|nr:alpha/beta hydrolase-fold protein [Streptomyces purpureus]GGT58692.1 esterase [Streptomyces purpureus]